jgi:hypothetical protein
MLNDVRKEDRLAYLLGPTIEGYACRSKNWTAGRVVVIVMAVLLLILLSQLLSR